jgi:membrane protease YdiL (CAAX protease family)
MDRRRAARALGLLLAGSLCGFATCHLAPPAGGSLAEQLAIHSLGLEIFLAAVALAGASLSRLPLRRRLGLGPSRIPARLLAVLVVGTVAVSHGLDGVIELLDLREKSSLAGFDLSLAGARGTSLGLALIGIGLAPAIGEELLCRGFVQRGLEARLPPLVAIPLASAFFGALHVDPVHAVFASLLGLYLGLAALLAGSIRAAIACHALNNLLAVASAAMWPGIELADPFSTGAGFLLAAACLWSVDRLGAAARLEPSRAGGASPRPADRP